MIISIWIEFLGSMFTFEPFYYFLASLAAVCSVLLIRSLKLW